MFCAKCGSKLDDNAKFCNNCGNSVDAATDIGRTVDGVIDDAQNQIKGAVTEVRNVINGTPNSGALKENWGILSYVLLTIITCGIYSWYTIYKISNDVNIACNGDGKDTAGLIKFLLLSLVTCGIYGIFWWYNLGNRLSMNASRYNMTFQENGTTVVLWMVFGSLICGIGSFVALHIIFKNTNLICHGYNTYSRVA